MHEASEVPCTAAGANTPATDWASRCRATCARLGAVVQAVGSERFGPTLFEFVSADVCVVDQIVAYALEPNRAGVELCNVGNLSPQVTQALTRRYLDSYHLMDPTAEEPLTQAHEGVRLTRMNPSIPGSSVYKDFFFHRTQLADRIAISTNWQRTRLAVHFYRHKSSPDFTPQDEALLHVWQDTIAAWLQQHYVMRSAAGTLMPAVSLQARIERLAKLTPREHDVFRRLISGLSADAIALDLEVSVNTVRTFRKKIYRKLEVTSRFDLIHKYVHLVDQQ